MKNTNKLIVIILVLLILFLALIICIYFLYKNISNDSNNFFNKFRVEEFIEDIGDADRTEESNLQEYEIGKILPYNESGQNPDFQAFYDELLAAVRKKDYKFLIEHVDDQIIYDYKINENDKVVFHRGKKGFEEDWQLDNNQINDFLWEELERIILTGGIFKDKEKTIFEAPHFRRELISIERDLNSQLPSESDYIEITVPIKGSVNVYKEPDINSEIIGNLSYDIVLLIDHGFEQETEEYLYYFYNIITPSGEEGYVIDLDMNTTYDYHIGITYKDENWKITEFYSGDE